MKTKTFTAPDYDTLYEVIVDNIRAGHYVGVKRKDNLWKVFTFVRGDAFAEGTSCKVSILECLASGVNSMFYSNTELKQYFTLEYAIVTPAPKLFNVGDTVTILESARELLHFDDFPEALEHMVGNVYEIKSVGYSEYAVWNKDKTNYFFFPFHCVAKVATQPKTDLSNVTDDELKAEVAKRGL